MQSKISASLASRFLVAAAMVLTTLGSFSAFAEQKQNSTGRYVVIYKSKIGFSTMESFLSLESGRARAYGLEKSLKHVNGMILNQPNAKVIEAMRNHPEVAVVEAERFTPAPKPMNGFKISKQQNSSTAFSHEVVAPPTEQDGPVLFQPGEKTPWGILAVKAPEAWALSDSGANARVLVLDTGIDKEHQDLVANFEKGKNFYKNFSDPDSENNFVDKEGHGTHCSGTIAAGYNSKTGFTGVAPKAKLLMGRVCGEMGCSNLAVVSGMNWGVEEKVDVISMSLGGPIGSEAELLAAENAEKAGVVIVAASGNSAGDPGYSPICGEDSSPFAAACGVSFPAAFPTVVAVGALNSDLQKTNFSQWGPELDITAPGASVVSTIPRQSGRDSLVQIVINGEKSEVKSAAFSGTKEITVPRLGELVYAGLGKTEDFAKVNVAGKFALISRGEIRFSEKVENALKAKATGVVIYNNAPGLMQGSLSEDGSEIDAVVVMIEQTVGQSLVEKLAQGKSAAAEVSTIRSDYAMFDGTSMATPHVAGVVALIKSANKKLTPAQVRMILTTTALPLGPNTTNEYGAGLVQADQAVKAAVGL